MEDESILDPSSEAHLWCLHRVFLPIINRDINTWKNAWINHPMRTEKNRSPLQLWVAGLQMAGYSETLSSNVVITYIYYLLTF